MGSNKKAENTGAFMMGGWNECQGQDGTQDDDLHDDPHRDPRDHRDHLCLGHLKRAQTQEKLSVTSLIT